ncbi:MAG TPA: ATP-binding protein, partial [Ilumatobacteraceae bacterium]
MADRTAGADHEEMSFAAEPDSPREARRFAATVLAYHAAPTDVARDLTLVVSELVTNFVEHSDGRQIAVIFNL